MKTDSGSHASSSQGEPKSTRTKDQKAFERVSGEGGRINVNQVAEVLDQIGCENPDKIVAQMLRDPRIQSELTCDEFVEAVVKAEGEAPAAEPTTQNKRTKMTELREVSAPEEVDKLFDMLHGADDDESVTGILKEAKAPRTPPTTLEQLKGEMEEQRMISTTIQHVPGDPSTVAVNLSDENSEMHL